MSIRVVLTKIVTVLSASDPSILKVPEASENLLLVTLITPLDVLLVFGVNVAVKIIPEPAKLLRVPPETTMSLKKKSVDVALSANESVAVSPDFRLALLLEIEMVGGKTLPYSTTNPSARSREQSFHATAPAPGEAGFTQY